MQERSYKHQNGRIPKIALCRGLTFPGIPPLLSGLTVIEQRLVLPRHEFMNIRSLGRERQHRLHEIVVNVNIYIDKNVFSYLGRSYSHKPFSCSCFESYHSRNLIFMRR